MPFRFVATAASPLNILIGVASVALPVAQGAFSFDPTGGWITSAGGLGLAAILCLRTMPGIVHELRGAIDHNTEAMRGALDRNTEALSMLREHCASSLGEDRAVRHEHREERREERDVRREQREVER